MADGTGWMRQAERGTVVVTSRDSNPAVWGRQAQVHKLGLLAEQAATEVLLDLAPAAGTRAEAQQLARRLGSLPLALQLAGAAIGSAYGPWASFADYHAALEDTRLEELRPDRYSVEAGDPRAVITSNCELSLDALARHGIQQARPLLRLLSCYAAAVPIPEGLLSGPATAALLADYEADDRAIDRRGRAAAERALALGLGGLARVGLIDLETVPGAPARPRWIVMHPLVAETSQLSLEASAGTGQASAVRHAAIKLLAARVSELIADYPADWKAWGMLVPHGFSLLNTSAPALDASDLAALLTAAASAIDFLDWSGATQAGYDLGCAAVARGMRLPPEDPALIHLRSRFACAIGALGRWDEAEGVYRQVLTDQEALGDDHPEALATRHELAGAVGEQGRWQPGMRSRTPSSGRGDAPRPRTNTARFSPPNCGSWARMTRPPWPPAKR